MTFTVQFDCERNAAAARTRGVASVQGFIELLQSLLESSQWKPGMNVLVDHQELDFTQLTIEDVSAFREFTKTYSAKIGSSRIASLLPNRLGSGISRMWDQPLLAESPFVHRAFTSLDDAKAWLAESTQEKRSASQAS